MKKIDILKITLLSLLSFTPLLSGEITSETNTTKATTIIVAEETPAPVPAPVEETNTTKETTIIVAEETPAPIPAPVEEETQIKTEVIKQTPTVVQAVSAPQAVNNDVTITMPLVPKPPVVTTKCPKLILLDHEGNLITKDTMEEHYPRKEKIIFSKSVAPPRFNVDRGQRKVKALAGDIKNGRVPAYLHTLLMSVDEAKEKLQSAGFEILTTFKVDKKGTATSIVYTNAAMKKAASQTTRGFAGALRITVDTKHKLLVISNPIYLMKAFMQKEYNKELAENTLKKLRDTFKGARNSEELVKFSILERFRFIENMPYYQDMKIIAEGVNADLLAKAKKSKQVVYEQKLDNGSVIIGVKLGKRTSKFVKKTGYENSGLLPYPVLIENGKAYILAPQYYIAIMYPMLKMSQFMKIATVPGAIAKDIDRIFR